MFWGPEADLTVDARDPRDSSAVYVYLKLSIAGRSFEAWKRLPVLEDADMEGSEKSWCILANLMSGSYNHASDCSSTWRTNLWNLGVDSRFGGSTPNGSALVRPGSVTIGGPSAAEEWTQGDVERTRGDESIRSTSSELTLVCEASKNLSMWPTSFVCPETGSAVGGSASGGPFIP